MTLDLSKIKANEEIAAEPLVAAFTELENQITNIPEGKQGPQGLPGANGKDGTSVSALAFAKDADGKITGGTITLSDGRTMPVTIN